MSLDIQGIEGTDETLSGRGGLALFVRYICSIGILRELECLLGYLRKSRKGLQINEVFKQILCFFCDGTGLHMTGFDRLKDDPGYAATIGTRSKDMASSHTMKRFFKAAGMCATGVFRHLLRRLFIWRLQMEQPSVIAITADTMVMNNDDAGKREGVQPTYKKVKGFQPLHFIWNGRIIDAVFRGGKKSGNYGNVVCNSLRRLIKMIRKQYDSSVPIIVRFDAGFYDEKIFKALHDMGVFFVATGKIYDYIKTHVGGSDISKWQRVSRNGQTFAYREFGHRAGTWSQFFRAIYTCSLHDEKENCYLEFARPETVIITNLGMNDALDYLCDEETAAHLTSCEGVIEQHHARGADELPHRGIKEFGTEKLPFKRFGPNCAYYYCMLISFFIFESYKRDVLHDMVSPLSYANTVRRKAIDFAAKIVRSGRRVVMKVQRAVLDYLQLDELWRRCGCAVPIGT